MVDVTDILGQMCAMWEGAFVREIKTKKEINFASRSRIIYLPAREKVLLGFFSCVLVVSRGVGRRPILRRRNTAHTLTYQAQHVRFLFST